MKVLVVEEKAGQQSAACASLQRQHHCVEQVCGGRAAISRASQQNYDLIVLDLVLSNDSSLLVLHEIRELNRDCEILVLSTPEQIQDRVTALIQGADDYLLKPFKLEDLCARILTLAKRRSNRKSIPGRAGNDHSKAAHLNRLIESLTQQDHGDNPGIELVFSEVKLAPLLNEVLSCLREAASHKDIGLQLSGLGLPTILVDVRWMEHLLVNLLSHAIALSPSRNQIDISFRAGVELGELNIESSLSSTVHNDGLTNEVNGQYCAKVTDVDEPIGPLSLAKFCAQHLNLQMHITIVDRERLHIQISNIRCV